MSGVKIHLRREWCKGCTFCVELCPKRVYVLSEEFSERGYHFPVVEREEECVACRRCEVMCPDIAIHVEKSGF